MLKKAFPHLLFLLAVIAAFGVYDYHNILQMRPNSIHQWRQTDGASIALNYYQDGLDITQPRVHHLLGNDGKMVSEVPLIPYLAAVCYELFGFNEIWFRLIGLILWFISLYYLFKLGLLLLKQPYYAACIALLASAYPVIAFYANNFLPDVPSLALTIVAWYYIVKHIQTNKLKWIVIASILFCFAALFKVTALINVIALIGIIIALKFNLFGKSSKLENRNVSLVGAVVLILPMLATVAWVFYAKHYNAINDNTYFTLRIRPLWDLPMWEVKAIAHRMLVGWSREYFFRPIAAVLTISSVFLFVKHFKSFKYSIISLAVLSLGCFTFFILFYNQFNHHDYYIICLQIPMILMPLLALLIVKEKHAQIFKGWALKAILGALLLASVWHCDRILYNRYKGKPELTAFNDFKDIEPYLRSLGIEPNDPIISIPDKSLAISLYLMNQTGYTLFYLGTETISNDNIGYFASIGVKYIMILGDEEYAKPMFDRYRDQLIGQHGEVYIVKL